MFFDRSDDEGSVLAFPVPPPPPSAHTRVRPFELLVLDGATTPTAPSVMTRVPTALVGEPPLSAPWSVPAWLPRSVEGPATFAVGAFGGAVLGLLAVMMTTLFMSQSAPCANGAPELTLHTADLGARTLLIAKPLTAPKRAAVAQAEDVAAPAAATTTSLLAARRAIAPRATQARTTATRRAQPKRDNDNSILAAALTP